MTLCCCRPGCLSRSLVLLKYHLSFYFLLSTFVLLWASQDLLFCFENKFQYQLFRLKAGKGFLSGNLQKLKKKISLKLLLNYTIPFLFVSLTHTPFVHLLSFTHQPCIRCLLCAVFSTTHNDRMVKGVHIPNPLGFVFMPFSRGSS